MSARGDKINNMTEKTKRIISIARTCVFAVMALSVAVFAVLNLNIEPGERLGKANVKKILGWQFDLSVKTLVFQCAAVKFSAGRGSTSAAKNLGRQISVMEAKQGFFYGKDIVHKWILLDYLGIDAQKPTLSEKLLKHKIVQNYQTLYQEGRFLDEHAPLFESATGDLARMKQFVLQGQDKSAQRLEAGLMEKAVLAVLVIVVVFLVFGGGFIGAVVFVCLKKPAMRLPGLIDKIPQDKRRVLGEAVVLQLFLMFPASALIVPYLPVKTMALNLLFTPMTFVASCAYFWVMTSRDILRMIVYEDRWTNVYREVLAGMAGYFAILPPVFLVLFVSVSFFPMEETAKYSHPIVFEVRENPLFSIVLAVLIAPVVEEVIFRGFLYGYLRRYFGVVISAFVTGVCFAVFHPQGIPAVAFLIAMGMGLCFLRELRPGLIAPMVTHMMVNGITVGLVYLLTGKI